MHIHASVLYIITDQIHRLGLSKVSVKTLVAKAKKADTPEKKTEVISKLNAIADAVWKKFLTMDVSKMSRTSAEDDSSPILLSHKLLALYFFQAHTYNLTTTPIAQYISLARRSKTTAAQEKLIQVANELAREIYTRYRKIFPAPHIEKKKKPTKKTPTSPIKSRVKSVVEKIEEVKESKIDDLNAVVETISNTPSSPSNVVTLSMLRERAKTLKVDISDLGRKKNEIITRLREAETAAHATTPHAKAKKPSRVIPKEVENDASLAPEPTDELPTQEILNFANKSLNTVFDHNKYIDIDRLKEDISEALRQRLPNRKRISFEVKESKDSVWVFYPTGLVESDQKLLRDALNSIAGNTSSGTSGSHSFFGLSHDKLFPHYGVKISVMEKLSQIPVPNSVETLLITWDNITHALEILRNYAKVTKVTADQDLITQWMRNTIKLVFGTTEDQRAEKVMELVTLIDPSAAVSARVTFGGLPAYVLIAKLSDTHFNILKYVVGGSDSNVRTLVGELLSHTKLVKYDTSKDLFKNANKLKLAIENIKTSVTSALDVDPDEFFSIKTIKGDLQIRVIVERKGYRDEKVKDKSVYSKVSEINKLILKGFTGTGYKVITDRLLRENAIATGATRGLKQMVERINDLTGEQFTTEDVYMTPEKEYLIIEST